VCGYDHEYAREDPDYQVQCGCYDHGDHEDVHRGGDGNRDGGGDVLDHHGNEYGEGGGDARV